MSSSRRVWALVALAASLCLCAPAAAQDRMAPALINTPSALTPDQQAQLDAYISNWAGQLTTGTDEQVVRGREKLIEPFTIGGTRIFSSAYSSSLSTALQQGLGSERLIVRLNAMMIVARMAPPDATTLIERALEDANAAIRYAAARAANELASRTEDKAPAAIQQRLLDSLTKQLNVERVQIVLEQLLLGISSLEINEASERLLSGLNRRVDLHVQDPKTPIAADREAMARLFRRYVLQNPNNNEVVVRLTQVAFRHLDLSTRLLEGGKLDEFQAGERLTMALLCDRILRWAAERHLAPGATLPESVEKILPAGNFKLARVHVEEWRRLLTGDQTKLRADQLNLPE